MTIEELAQTPDWATKAKYRSVLAIVLDPHDWKHKYEVLEGVIDALLKDQRDSIIKEVWATESAADSFEEGVVVEALRKDVISILKQYDQQR